MKKFFTLLVLMLLCSVGAWAQVGPFTFTNWVYNSYTRVGGTEGTATYTCNTPIYLQQKGVEITNEGDLTVTLTYTSGSLRLEIYGVDLVNESTGNVVYSNYSHKYAGGDRQGQVYTLSNVAAGTYSLRIWSSVWGLGNQLFDGAKDSKGNIAYTGTAAEGVTFTHTTWDNMGKRSDWKTSGAIVPAGVMSLIKAQNFKQYNNIHYHDDSNLTFSEAKTYNINYNYTGADGGGNERMDIRGVEILDESNNVVACDYHEGYTGNAASNRDYKVEVPAGTYTVRTLVQTGNANDVRCKGNVTYSVIDGSAIATNYTTNIKPNLYDNDVLKIGAPVQSLLTALETAIEGGNDIAIEAAYNAVVNAKNINLPTGYYRMHNFKNDKSTLYYAYNDYNHTGNTNHYTLMSTSAVNTNNGLWHVTNNGTSITIQNGDGQPLVYDNNQKTALNFGEFKIDYFKNYVGGIYFTEGVHGTNQAAFSLADGTRRATAWAYTTSEGSRWAFEPVEPAGIYNVVVTGADGYVTLNSTNEYAYNGGFFNAASITESDITAQDIAGYTKVVNVAGNTITVTYTYVDHHPYLVFKCERGGVVANTNGYLTTATYNEAADNQKFVLVNIEKKDYLYNPALHKFVTSPASGKTFVLVDYPHHAYTTESAANPSDNYTTILKINNQYMNNNGSGSMVNGWNDEDGGNRFQINEVGGISDADYDALVASVKAACDAKKADMKAKNDAYDNTTLGVYSWTNYDATTAAVTASQALNTGAENYYTSLFAEIRKFDIAYQLTLNLPQPGTFLRIKNTASNKYIAFTGNDNAQVPLQTDGTTKETVLYYDENRHIISYSKGQGLKDTHSQCPVGGSMETATFADAGNGLYSIQSNYSGSKVWHGSGNALNRQGTVDNNCKWILEEVTELPVTLPTSGITTFYAPVAMHVNGDVNVYVGAIDEEETTITYTKLADNKIPAGTGVLIKGTPSASITISPIDEEVTEQSSIILGKEYTTACTQDGETFIYTLSSGVFQYYTGSTLAGFKGHLELKKNHQDSNSPLRVVFEDELLTGVEAIAAEANQSIFDLQGRRVNNAQKGLYIINGRKVVR